MNLWKIDGYDFGEAVAAMRQGYQDGGKAKYKYQTRKAPPGFMIEEENLNLKNHLKLYVCTPKPVVL